MTAGYLCSGMSHNWHHCHSLSLALNVTHCITYSSWPPNFWTVQPSSSYSHWRAPRCQRKGVGRLSYDEDGLSNIAHMGWRQSETNRAGADPSPTQCLVGWDILAIVLGISRNRNQLTQWTLLIVFLLSTFLIFLIVRFWQLYAPIATRQRQ